MAPLSPLGFFLILILSGSVWGHWIRYRSRRCQAQYDVGIQAAMNQRICGTHYPCQYPKGSLERRYWEMGWEAVFFDLSPEVPNNFHQGEAQ